MGNTAYNQNRAGKRAFRAVQKINRFKAKDFIGVRQKSQRRQAYGTYMYSCIGMLIAAVDRLLSGYDISSPGSSRQKGAAIYTASLSKYILCTQQTLLSAYPKKKSSSIFLLFSM
jgi:hypothetical protein